MELLSKGFYVGADEESCCLSISSHELKDFSETPCLLYQFLPSPISGCSPVGLTQIGINRLIAGASNAKVLSQISTRERWLSD